MKKLLPSLILLVLLLGAAFLAREYFTEEEIPVLYSVPDFTFPSQQGISFSNQDFSGKITVADFIFTNCPGICPMMSSEMLLLYREFESDDNIQFVSFSVDPQRDSIQALTEYAEKWGVHDQRWHFLRTDSLHIKNLYEQGFKLGGDLPYSHSTKFVLIDNNNFIRGYYDFDNKQEIEVLKEHISLLESDI